MKQSAASGAQQQRKLSIANVISEMKHALEDLTSETPDYMIEDVLREVENDPAFSSGSGKELDD